MRKGFLRKIYSCVIIMAFIFSYTSIYAQEERSVEVNGSIEPISDTYLDVIIPTKFTFIIDKNRNFISPKYSLENKSPNYVKATVVSVKSDISNSCKIVNNDKFSDTEWSSLSRDDTLKNIALGFKIGSSSNWLKSEDINSNIELGTMDINKPLETTLIGKYGKNWGNNSDTLLNYKLTLMLEMV